LWNATTLLSCDLHYAETVRGLALRIAAKIKDRYELREILGRGGMGVVFRGFDTLMRREVAIKTLRDAPTQVFIDLFYRECGVLAAMVHPNIVEIFDMGEFEEDGVSKPYFVMPLLPGRTLHDLIYPAKQPLTASRCVDIMSQTCRGLQAAHDRGLLHRDIKPRNIFVINDDAVKIIDFGIAHLLDSQSSGVRGTLQYMAPEQIMMKPLTTRTDIFSLGTVCYESLTAVHPFFRESEPDMAAAITGENPVLASELNPNVSRGLAQVIAKAMAKDAWSRFASANEFSEALQKALRNEPLRLFDPSGVRLRVDRARRSFAQNDYQFASEILRELESEGHTDADIVELHRELKEAIRKETTQKLLESANHCFNQEEYSLALRKIQEVLDLDAGNSSAINLRKRIESTLTEQKVSELLQVATQHLEQSAFTNARQAVQDALRLKPTDARARQLLAEIDAKQKELLRQRQEQERLYQAAQAAWLGGKIDSAIDQLEQLVELSRRAGDQKDRVREYKEFHRLVRSEHSALQTALTEARKKLEGGDLSGAQSLCDSYLRKYPTHAGLGALSSDIEAARKEKAAAYLRDVVQRLGNEPDLGRQGEILEAALRSYPDERYFQEELRLVQEKQALVGGIVERARNHESAGRFLEAIEQWKMLETVYPAYPGLAGEIEQAETALQRQRAEKKAKYVKESEAAIAATDYAVAVELLNEALQEFPGDGKLLELQREATSKRQRQQRFESVLTRAGESGEAGRFHEAINALSEAEQLAEGVSSWLKSMFDKAIELSDRAIDVDWRAAEAMLQQAARIHRESPVPTVLWERVRAAAREEDIRRYLSDASEAESASNFARARQILQEGISGYPNEQRLKAQLRRVVATLDEIRRREERERDLRDLVGLKAELESLDSPSQLSDYLAQCESLLRSHQGDIDFTTIAADIKAQIAAYEKAGAVLSEDRIPECIALCNEFLNRNPKNALFLGLKSQAEARERTLAVEYLEQVEQRLAVTQDLEQRERILVEALERYPDEIHFQHELELVRNERKLVDAMVAQAQEHERAGLLAEALEEWKSLRTIYPLYAGLEEEIARIEELWQNKRRAAKENWLMRAKAAIDQANYSLAGDHLRKALAEFPGDGDLEELNTTLEARVKLRTEAESLLTQARQLFAQGRFGDAQVRAIQATQAGRMEPGFDRTVADLLIQQAGKCVASDWRMADSLVQHALATRADLRVPQGLSRQIDEARREDEVSHALQEVRALEESGGLTAALSSVQDSLSKFPNHPQLLRAQTRLMRAIEEAKRQQQRAQSLDALRRCDEEAKTVTSAEGLLQLLKRTANIANRHSRDEEVTRVANQVSGYLRVLADVRNRFEEGALDDAYALCNQHLAAYPDDPGLLVLKAQLEERLEERAVEYLRSVEQKLASEHDWTKQVEILEEALKRYPNENYYRAELELVENKQKLWNGAVAHARELESKGLLEQAIAEWTNLGAIYPEMAAIPAEIERISQEAERRKAALRETWKSRIRQVLTDSDYRVAGDLVRQALSELPGDAELLELEWQLQSSVQRREEAYKLVEDARRLFEGGQWAAGNQQLQAALERDAGDRELERLVAQDLIRYAPRALNSDWHAAESMVAGAVRLRPEISVPADVAAGIEAAKRESEICALLSVIDKAIAQQNWNDARRRLEQAQTQYPRDQRLTERIAFVQNAIKGNELRQLREKALVDLRQLREDAGTAKRKRLPLLLEAAQRIARAEFADEEVRSLAASVTELVQHTISAQAPAAKPRQQPEPKAQDAPTRVELQTPATKRRVPALVVILAGALAVAALVLWLVFPSRALTPVELSGAPDGVSIVIDGVSCVTPNCKLRLAPGTHILRAEKQGFIPLSIPITIGKTDEGPVRVTVALHPTGPLVQVATNLDHGDVLIDRGPAEALNNGQFRLQSLDPGRHSLRISGSDSEAVIPFKIAEGKPPQIVSPVSTKNVTAAIVMSSGSSGQVVSSTSEPQSVAVDGTEVGVTNDGSLALPNLPPGDHKIVLQHGKDSLKFSVPVTGSPSLYAFIALDRDIGTLIVQPDVDGAAIFINNRRYKGPPARGGQLRVPLPSGDYEIRAEREGYESSKNLRASVTKGGETAVPLHLSPKPSRFEIRGLPQGTQVSIDGRFVATANNAAVTGVFPPGKHTIEFAKNGYKTRSMLRNVEPGQMVTLAGSDVVLDPVAVDIAAAEAADWNRVKDTRNVSELQAFINKYRSGTHLPDAKAKIEELDWSTVDRKNRTALQSYLNRYPQGAHASQAQELLNEITQAENSRQEQADWDAVDTKNKASLTNYLATHASGKHAAEVRQALNDLIKQEQLKAAQDAQAAASLRKAQEQSQADANSILSTINRYADAWGKKDMGTIVGLFPTLDRRTVKKSLGDVNTIQMILKPTAAPSVTGDTATVSCTRSVQQSFRNGPEMSPPPTAVTVRLSRHGANWLIDSIN
jgi:serine/threonine-protein kinase